MSFKKIAMIAVAAVVTVVIGLAIVNRAKKQFPMIATVIGE